jgi:alpha-1,6-mannosyltransferase
MLASLHLLTLLLYLMLAYGGVPRSNFTVFITLYAALVGLYALTYRFAKTEKEISVALLATSGFRIALLFALPTLSDDVYRFIWDGKLVAHGESPFSAPPRSYSMADLAAFEIEPSLFANLNSPDYFSVYPPVCQVIFFLAVKCFPQHLFGSAVVMKLFVIGFDLGSLALLKKLMPTSKRILLYALNPLVIIELSGNLHFESAMIFFLLAALFFLFKAVSRDGAERRHEKIYLALAAVMFACSVCSKLLPLVLLPVLTVWLGRNLDFKRGIIFTLIALITTVIFFVPFLSVHQLENLISSLRLYQQTFEFNASVYYVIREIGFWAVGYNIIAVAGKSLAVLTFVVVMWIAFSNRLVENIYEKIFAALVVYVVLATTVHPWYLSTLVMLSVFVRWRFALVWSGMAGVSYFTYTQTPYSENLWLVLLEYGVTLAVLCYEWRQPELLQTRVSKALSGRVWRR